VDPGGSGGAITLRRELAERTLAAVGERLGEQTLDVALGVVRVANAEMVRALRVISVERGLDPREFTLVAFGGAGGLHACALAEEMGMARVLVPAAGGVLSALGLAISDLRRDYVRPLLGKLDEVDPDEADRAWRELEEQAGHDLDGPDLDRQADLRYRGQSFELTVGVAGWDELEERFHVEHERRYGFRMDDETVELVNLRLVATVAADKPEIRAEAPDGEREPGRREVNLDGDWQEVDVVQRRDLGPGAKLDGPAVVEFAEATLLLRPGWRAALDEVGTLVLDHQGEGKER